MSVFQLIKTQIDKKSKMFALLIDPDQQTESQLKEIISIAEESKVDLIFVGGSLLKTDSLDLCITTIKNQSRIPIVLFPGNTMQINNQADAILFLSLISGRNAEMLIGKQVMTAPILKKTALEIISAGYMLIESGQQTTASYMSNTTPIPHAKNDIATATAMAGEMLGLKLIFMDGGSGAINCISEEMITSVKRSIKIPLIVGGGICSAKQAVKSCNAGADIIVVGNAIEKDSSLINKISTAVHDI